MRIRSLCAAAACSVSLVSAAPPPSWAFSDISLAGGFKLIASATSSSSTTAPPFPMKNIQNKEAVVGNDASASVFYTTVECKIISGVEWCAIATLSTAGSNSTTMTASTSKSSITPPYPSSTKTSTLAGTGSSSTGLPAQTGSRASAFGTSATQTTGSSLSASSSIPGTGTLSRLTGTRSANGTASQSTSTYSASGSGYITSSSNSTTSTTKTSTKVSSSTAVAWSASDCNSPEATNAALNQSMRWNKADAPTAWTDAVDSWNKRPSSNVLGFPEQIANFLHGPEQMHCDQLSSRDGCGSDVACTTVGHPASAFILNSFVAISDLNWNIYDSISKAQGQVTGLMGPFATTFAPIDDPDAGLKIMLDILGLGFALFAAPVWNIGTSSPISSYPMLSYPSQSSCQLR